MYRFTRIQKKERIEILTNNFKKECKTIEELKAVFKNTCEQFKDDI